jgi:hypothetical protein
VNLIFVRELICAMLCVPFFVLFCLNLVLIFRCFVDSCNDSEAMIRKEFRFAANVPEDKKNFVLKVCSIEIKFVFIAQLRRLT